MADEPKMTQSEREEENRRVNDAITAALSGGPPAIPPCECDWCRNLRGKTPLSSIEGQE